jgi:hypothetical protein
LQSIFIKSNFLKNHLQTGGFSVFINSTPPLLSTKPPATVPAAFAFLPTMQFLPVIPSYIKNKTQTTNSKLQTTNNNDNQ